MKTRNWSIRSKIIALILVPLTALTALWIFATALSAGPAFNLLSARTLQDTVRNPGEALVGELQRERWLSVEYLAAPGGVPPTLIAQRAATDRAAGEFRQAAGGAKAQEAASDALKLRIARVVTELNQLAGNRQHVDRREMDDIGAQGFYNSMISSAFEMFTATATFNNEQIDQQLRGLTTIARGQEYLSRVDSLQAGATAAGRFSADLHAALVQDVGTARFLLDEGVNDMPAENRTAYQRLSNGAALAKLSGMLDTLITKSRPGAASPVPDATWRPAYVASAQQLRAFELAATDSLADRAEPVGRSILVRLGVAGVLGLLAVIVSIIVSIEVGRSIVRRLRRLRADAQEMADERLPGVVRRLQHGEVLDVDAETPPLEYGNDEIGQVGHAFNDVQRTAVQSAVEEANVRRGLNEVFLNIARRSQALLHRQLALLDKMERRESGPEELEDLYRVDHLATRMRRHAEDLVILAGAAPGRGWRNPVPIIDVVRGAISEVEDYKRIDIRSVEASAVLGRAVGDIIHLLAELLENAAAFSPPHTRVQVSGQPLPNGYVIEIEDRGLGMTPEAIDEANRRLREPPDFDPADSARLGLFVVAQLAHRHRIQVSLRPSAFAGVTAIALIPGDLIVGGPEDGGLLPGSPGDDTWDRPLVGSGHDDSPRHPLPALQWQDADELRPLPVAGRPVTIEGTATPVPALPGRGALTGQHALAGHSAPVGPHALAGQYPPPGQYAAGQHRADGGPAPSSIAGDTSADGLVQRRRLRRPVDLATATEAAREAQVGEASRAEAVRNAVPRSGRPGADRPRSGRAVTDLPGSTEDGLPRRVRQASLAPQLRRPATEEAAAPPPAAEPLPSPEQARSRMNSLQTGTTRGRIDASRHRSGPPVRGTLGDRPDSAVPESASPSGGPSFADAATVSFPAIVNLALARGEASTGEDAAGDRARYPRQNDVTRPEKDTK